ncbi:MAG: hypothetical protein ACK4I8_03840, partial [Armatimonadota bacterium]
MAGIVRVASGDKVAVTCDFGRLEIHWRVVLLHDRNSVNWRARLLPSRKISAHLEVRPPERKNCSAHKD